MNDLVCFVCRNDACESYTIFRGYYVCEYCLNDFQVEAPEVNFEFWSEQHKIELDKERGQEK